MKINQKMDENWEFPAFLGKLHTMEIGYGSKLSSPVQKVPIFLYEIVEKSSRDCGIGIRGNPMGRPILKVN